ncbi:MAG: pyrroloquinoline quinone-dependent dehydrogenase [Pseudomonadales bacterium]
MKVLTLLVFVLVPLLLLSACNWEEPVKSPFSTTGITAQWPSFGGGDQGQRHTPLEQISAANVSSLREVWRYRTGDMSDNNLSPLNLPAFEATPIQVNNGLYFCSPRGRVISLHPETGEERWVFDPETNTRGHFLVTCRGVSYDEWPQALDQECGKRIYVATLDARLIALDADSGKPCADFGADGVVNLLRNMGDVAPGEYSMTSPPAVADHQLIVGGLVLDNQRIDSPAGVIRAYDARTGKLNWFWNPHPDESKQMNLDNGVYARGTPNAWGVFSVDLDRRLVYVPTGNAPIDFYPEQRQRRDHYASSVLALDIDTGKLQWQFQTVHGDIWDYDVGSQPVLLDIDTGGEPVPTLIQATKTGRLFWLNRETGQPLTPIEERPTPRSEVRGQALSPTQPMPMDLPLLHPQTLSEDDMWGFTPLDEWDCRRRFRELDNEGIFTPPCARGVVHYPSNLGASNWGSVAIDPQRRILVANTNRVVGAIKLIPRQEADAIVAAGGALYSPGTGGEFAIEYGPMLSIFGAPCNRPPWGLLTAIDLDSKDVLWEKPLGTTRDVSPVPFVWLNLGVPNTGGTLLTASGLIFVGAAADDYIRAFDIHTGTALWKARLPAGGQATPMSYRLSETGRQFVVIAAGGHKNLGTTLGDYVVAYALEGP